MSNDKKEVAKAEPVVPSKPAKSEIAQAVADAVAESMSQVVPIAIAASRAVAVDAQNTALAARRGDLGDRCQDCRQFATACKGEHVEMIVHPRNERLGRFFTGLKLNGVNYRSANGSQLIKVPKDNDFAKMLENFEQSEDDFMHGRTAEHNSGSLGANGGQTNPAFVPNWR